MAKTSDRIHHPLKEIEPEKVKEEPGHQIRKDLPWHNPPKLADRPNLHKHEVEPPSAHPSLDPKQSVSSLIAEHKLLDKRAKAEEHSSAGSEKTSSAKDKVFVRHELPSKVKVIFEEDLPIDSKHPKRQPDFVITTKNNKTQIDVHNDPEKNPQRDGQILISIARSDNQLDPRPAEKEKLGELLTYIYGRTHNLHPHAPNQKLDVEDDKGLVNRDVLRRLAKDRPRQYSPETDEQVKHVNRIEGGKGILSHFQLESYFPPREVKPHQNEGPGLQAMKNAYISLVNPEKQNPYETVHKSNDGSYCVGIGLNYRLITSWCLQRIGVPPDSKKIDELATEGLISADFAQKMKRLDFQIPFAEFMLKLKGGSGPVSSQEISKYLPKELQETILTDMIKTYAHKDGNPGRIALSLMLGKSPDQLSQADVANNKQYEDAAARLFALAEAKQADTNHKGVVWDGTTDGTDNAVSNADGLKTSNQPLTEFEQKLVEKAQKIAGKMSSHGKCAEGVQFALSEAGVNVMGSGNGWEMQKPLIDKGWVPIDPTREPIRPGYIVCQKWAPDVVKQNNNQQYGDIFIVTGVDSDGRIHQANDHTQTFDPHYARYSERVYLKPPDSSGIG